MELPHLLTFTVKFHTTRFQIPLYTIASAIVPVATLLA